MIFSAKLSRYLVLFTIVVLSSIIFPKFYSMLFDRAIPGVRIYYSSINHNFLFMRYTDGTYTRKDKDGKIFAREEFERLTPFLSYRQLAYREELPDSISGVAFDIQKVRLNNIQLKIKPTAIHKYTIPLNPLFESNPGRPDLQMPNEFFRISDKMEFINCTSNKIETELSTLFNKALVEKGFSFPAKGIYGNPTTRKPFDEGYFIIDSNNKLFHLKRVNNKPYVKKIELPDGVKVVYASVRELNLKEFYAILVTDNNKLFIVSYDNYKLIEVPSEGYDRKNMIFYFKGNMFYREISFVSNNSIKIIVTDRNYKVVDTYKETWQTNKDSFVGDISNYIFPFKLSLTDGNNRFVNFYLEFADFRFLFFSFIATIFFFFYNKQRMGKFQLSQVVDLVIILLTGIYGLLAVMLIREEK